MEKIFRKRMFRDLKENFFRYLALGVLIILGMYIVISLVGAADTMIKGTAAAAEKQRVEDGQFTSFVPLSQEEISALEKKGVILEEHFYLDYDREDNSTLRIFSERKEIDLPQPDFGELPKGQGEIFLEKRYCEEYSLLVGDKIDVGGHDFQICGIGTVPDYDAPLCNLSDSAVDSSQFGVGFVTEEDYGRLLGEGLSVAAQEYVYAYRLQGEFTQEQLKKKLQKQKVSREETRDVYFIEYWDRTGGKLDEFKDALEELSDGSGELWEGLRELDKNSGKLTEGSSDIFEAYLKEAAGSLSQLGVSALTKENYSEVITGLIENNDSGLARMKLRSLLEQLRDLDAFEKGTGEYTKGVSEAAEGSGELSEGMSELAEETKDFLDDNFDVSLSNLTQFLPARDNPRIGAAAEDQVINRASGLVAGVIFLILLAYCISVFVVQNIEEESAVIGTLYAMGVKRGELLRHYLTLPVLLTWIAGILGTALGYSSFGIPVQMQDCYKYFSVPVLQPIYEPYLLLYGILLPPLAAALTNFLVIRKKLSKPVLTLIRKEQKTGRMQNIKLKGKNFVQTFWVRQMLRERRTAFTVFFGMFVSLLIVMLSLNCYVLCQHIKEDNRSDTRFEYMYTYKYPPEQVPEGGEEAYGMGMKKEMLGYNLDVTLLGIHEKNPYFDAPVKKGTDSVWISSAMAQKYQLKKGDELVLNDEEAQRKYAFTVEGIVPYSTSFFAFMEIDSLRELMGQEEGYFNMVFSDHDLNIDRGRLYSTTSRTDVEKSAAVFVEMMRPMVVMLTVISALIFAVVMYLMMKVMVDRSTLSISLMKVLGYRKKEIGKLYLNGNLLVVILSALAGIPLSKIIMDSMYPYMVANIACGMDLTFPWQMYAGIMAAILVLYFLINRILMRKVNQILPAEVLKNRE